MSDDFLEWVATVCKWITILGGSLLFITLAATWFMPDTRDDSDSPTQRSGMMILTDYGTGCQYLWRNGLTPRMDANGKQVCNR